MNIFIIFAALFTVALAASDCVKIPHVISGLDRESYRFIVEYPNGFRKSEEGRLENNDTGHKVMVVRGSYSWSDKKTDNEITINYVIDENGFLTEGCHFPKA